MDWNAYLVRNFAFMKFPPGALVVELGCGPAGHLRALEEGGYRAVGIDVDPGAAVGWRRDGVRAVLARAEETPIKAGVCDGAICQDSLPYTDEIRVIAEIARILRPGGTALLSGHGPGCYVRYVLGGSWRERFYGTRALVSTWFYRATGRRAPKFGDTLFQSTHRLERYYRSFGLEVIEEQRGPSFLGLPVFIYHAIHKVP